MKNFTEIKEMLLQDYAENFDPNDTNEEVKDWLTIYADFEIEVQNEKMQKHYNIQDIEDNQIIVIKNEEELQDELFDFNGDTWEIVD